MSIKILLTISLGLVAANCWLADAASAISFTANLSEFTDGGTDAGIITLEDVAGGGIRFTAEITKPTINGDIAGLWFGVTDTNLLSSLSVSNLTTSTGETSFNLLTSTSSCPSSGQNNLNGGGTPCSSGLLNSLISFGKAGSSDGLIQSVSFILNSSALTSSFSIDDLNESFGLRYQSTDANKGGSSKLRYHYPGYMGTTSDTFTIKEGQTPPPGAVPVGGFEKPEDDPLNTVHPSGKNKNKNKNK
ncbi:MAG: hypothetical protein WBB82_14625 [Limnothrix sp.]